MASDDDHLARDLAVVAGRRLVDLRARGGTPDELRQAGDRTSHEFLTTELARLRPDDVVLSEEGADDPARLTADRVWIVDPLDGTREFGEPGRGGWARRGCGAGGPPPRCGPPRRTSRCGSWSAGPGRPRSCPGWPSWPARTWSRSGRPGPRWARGCWGGRAGSC